MKQRHILKLIICYALLFSGCEKFRGNSTRNAFYAAIYATCSSTNTHNYSSQDTEALKTTSGFQISGNTSTDEIGLNFYGTPVVGTKYQLNTASTFHVDLYWDPGDTGVNEYGSLSGEVTVTELVLTTDGFVQSMEVNFENVSLIDPIGHTLCISDGKIVFDRG